ncbi:MAG: hypothetical protein ABMA26_23450 [Limisphaerales bacterium]
MAMTWMFLLVVFAALCAFAMVIGVMVMLFRAASRSSARPAGDNGVAGIPPVITDDSTTNPANPLYHLHHPTHLHSSDAGPSHSSSDSAPGSSSSFDSGSSANSSFDSGSSPSSSDSGSNCG